MSAKAIEKVREACHVALATGLRLRRGPWFEFAAGVPVACCALGAVLYVPGQTAPPADLANPGYVKRVCTELGVDIFWLTRFWLGWDRIHQVSLLHEKDGKTFETKDEISAAAIALAREMGLK